MLGPILQAGGAIGKLRPALRTTIAARCGRRATQSSRTCLAKITAVR
jgi:hypothetical protein